MRPDPTQRTGLTSRVLSLFSFAGRSRRLELVFLPMLTSLPVGLAEKLWSPSYFTDNAAHAALELLFTPLTLWLLGAVAVRRLHDWGRSGWWALLGAPPTASLLWLDWLTFRDNLFLRADVDIGLWRWAVLSPGLVLLVLLLWNEDAEANLYGPNPRFDPPGEAQPA